MSHISTTVMTTTPPVTVVSSGLSSVSSVTMATMLGAERLWRCYWPCLCATAATSIFDASSGLCQLFYGFSTGRFLFQS